MPGKITSDRRGGILLEYCLCFVLLLFIWAFMCNMSLVLKDKLTVIAAAREAGRYYTAIEQSEAGARQKGYEILSSGGISADRAQIEIHKHKPQYNLVQCEVTCRVPLAIPGASALLGGEAWEKQLTVRETAVFRLNN